MNYKPLSNNEKSSLDRDEFSNEQLEDPARLRRSRILHTGLAASIVLILILGILNLVFTINNGPSSTPPTFQDYSIWRNCGSSASEARERGCIFDIMMTGWVKKECYHEELSEQYLQEGDFRFFYDIEGKKEMPMDLVRRGEHHHMFTNDLHHRAHCVYVWKLQALALESQARGEVQLISNESMSYDHTVHCAHILVKSNPDPPYSMNYGEVDYLTCGPYLS